MLAGYLHLTNKRVAFPVDDWLSFVIQSFWLKKTV